MAAKIPLSKIMHDDFSWAIMQLMAASVPAKAAYWLSKIFKKVESHQKHFDTARRKTLIKYVETEKAPDGTEVIKRQPLVPPFTDPEKMPPIWKDADSEKKFNDEMLELIKEEVEVPTIRFALIGDDAKFPTNVLLLLEDIVLMDEGK